MATSANQWLPVAFKLLLAIARRTPDGRPTRYEPAAWFRQRPTSRNRSRWSRWTRRLASAGMVRRLTEANRDRVRQVAITKRGLAWIHEHRRSGALYDLDLNWADTPLLDCLS